MVNSELLDIIVRGKDQDASKVLEGVNKNLKKTETQSKRTNKGLVTLRSGIGKTTNALFSLKAAIAGVGIGLIAKSFLDAATTAEGYRTRLVTLLGDVEKANQLFQDMSKYASGVAFEYEGVMGAATALSGVMQGGVKEINEWMPLIGDLAAAAGLGIEESTSQVIRMYSAGAASADLFRERGILAMLGFQAGVSVSAEETRKRLIAAWEDPASKIRGAAAALSRTWDGMMSMMGDAWFQFRTMVMDAGVFDFLKASVSLLLEQVNELKETGELADIAERVGQRVLSVLGGVVKGAALVGDVFRGWEMIWQGLKMAFAFFMEAVFKGIEFLQPAVKKIVNTIGVALEKLGKAISAVDFLGISDGITDSIKKAGKYLQMLKGDPGKGTKLAEYWRDVAFESDAALGKLAVQESSYKKVDGVLASINKRMKEYAEGIKKAPRVKKPDLKPLASTLAMAKSEVARLNATMSVTLEKLGIMYKKGEIDLAGYYAERLSWLDKQYNAELAMLRKLEEKETDPSKKLGIQDKIFARTQKFEQDKLKLVSERAKSEVEVEKRKSSLLQAMDDLRARAVGTETPTIMGAQFEKEKAELQKRQEDEVARLQEFNATKEQINEAHRLHELEQDKLAEEQKKKVQEYNLQAMHSSLNFLEESFGAMYEASGKKIKEFFYLQKAASIANTLISTYQSAQDAYKALVGIKVVGPTLAIAAAGIATAAGLARVAMMKGQQLASGGVVKGSSPTQTSDNIPIQATAGEYMQPVSAVQYYGKQAMDALRAKAVPKELFSGFQVPIPRRSSSHFMAAGGPVPTGSGKGGAEGGVTIANFIDPALFEEFVASPAGKNAVVNLLSQNAYEVNQTLQRDG